MPAFASSLSCAPSCTPPCSCSCSLLPHSLFLLKSPTKPPIRLCSPASSAWLVFAVASAPAPVPVFALVPAAAVLAPALAGIEAAPGTLPVIFTLRVWVIVPL